LLKHPSEVQLDVHVQGFASSMQSQDEVDAEAALSPRNYVNRLLLLLLLVNRQRTFWKM
jgi:hypothetical protein